MIVQSTAVLVFFFLPSWSDFKVTLKFLYPSEYGSQKVEVRTLQQTTLPPRIAEIIGLWSYLF